MNLSEQIFNYVEPLNYKCVYALSTHKPAVSA